MSNYLDPIAAAEQPREDFIRYLLTAYPLRDPHLRYGLKQQLEQPGAVWQHPYLEGSQPYKPADSVRNLVADGVLHPEMANLFTLCDRPLYKHQEQAIRAVVEQQQNIVVATGTGSGKTECFLIPMLDMLLKEGATLSNSGVRVLILYPMNALVNDQVKRLRQLLCCQGQPLIRFGFYTSRTESDAEEALKSLKEEFVAYDREELLKLFTPAEKQSLNLSRPENLVQAAVKKTRKIQAISREEFWVNPPHILVTNYSMLEHMLIRPTERTAIFQASGETFKLLVVDEAHSYDGSTGTEVSMLLKRLKAAVVIEKPGRIRCIATSASLGEAASSDPRVIEFAQQLFGESFTQVIRGDRVTASDRLGHPHVLPDGLAEEDIWEFFEALSLPPQNAPLDQWATQLSYLVPSDLLESAKVEAKGNINRFLWLALKQHPTVHKLIEMLSGGPQPWHQVARASELWQLPTTLEGEFDPKVGKQAERALAHLVQLGTLAREHDGDLPLLPVRLHLLFRSIEGLYACVNPKCPEAPHDPNYPDYPKRYGRLYLSQKTTCECEGCNSPVLELSSCRKCGQAYSLACIPAGNQGSGLLQPLPRAFEGVESNKHIYTLTSGSLDSITDDEEVEETAEDDGSIRPQVGTFVIRRQADQDGWLGRAVPNQDPAPSSYPTSEKQFSLIWQIPPVPKNLKKADKPKDWEGGYLPKCAACGARRNQSHAIGRFVSYTDAPLEVMIDSLLELLPDPDADWQSEQPTKRKLLTFSDGRQDAAFFASDFQRTHTEAMYRQLVWRAFQGVKCEAGIASVKQVENRLEEKFLEISIPHPDRLSDLHHFSYVANDPIEDKSKNVKDCRDRARERAKELLLREFGLPSARRFSLEALGLLACHIEWPDERLPELMARRFNITPTEARVFLTGLTDTIRLAGIVDLQGSSNYFPETGGDGVRPGMLDKGRSRVYLKLIRVMGESHAVSFLWRSDEKTGEPLDIKRQNRIVAYYWNFLGQSQPPSKEDLNWLFDLLTSRDGCLTGYKTGSYQLNWELLNITQTKNDWYECNSCQQVFHIPGLAEIIDTSKLNVKGCPAYKCRGYLKRFEVEQHQDNRKEIDHYRYLIRHRKILPLRSQEHTAQLGVVELEKRENRFRQGKINLLSCSTTLEMGVDIGELQAVALRNFPPHVNNYQQRAGRAGRRTDGVAITLMYGQRRPHDRFYFEQPARLIAGKNQIPKLEPNNFQIQQRHIRAELLAEFLRQRNIGAEGVIIAAFFLLPAENPLSAQNFSPPPDAMVSRFHEWLHTDQARCLTQLWLDRFNSSHSGLVSTIVENFAQEITKFQRQQLEDWNTLAKVMNELQLRIADPAETKNLPKIANLIASTKRELDKVAKRRLHNELAQASVLPIYGFPIDVVRLLTGHSDQYKSSQGRHRLERDRRLALGEYAPSQEIVVDDRVHTSVGILRPDDLEKQYYWVCNTCNYFEKLKQEKLYSECPVCKSVPPNPSEQKMRAYIVPKSFTTDWGKPPKVTPYIKPLRQPTSQVFLAQDGENPQFLAEPQYYQLTSSQGGLFFLANQGPLADGRGFKNKGFAICKNCGRDLSDQVRERQREFGGRSSRSQQTSASSATSRSAHEHPISGKPCLGWYEHTHLGHEFRSDLLKIRFDRATNPSLLYTPVVHYGDDYVISSVEDNPSAPVSGLGFWRSLTSALLAAAAQVIDVRREELDALFRPYEGGDGVAEVIIYDNVPGGAGYSKRIALAFKDVLKRAYDLIESCTCDTSCYDCLRTYSNQPFHAELNRHVVADFLKAVVEQVQPDLELQNFAPSANRVSLSQIAERLPALCRMAGPFSMIYLPQLTDMFGLNNGVPLSWLKLLTDAVYSMQRSRMPLELIVNQLPEPSSDSNQVLRKRLQQWIDQGLLKLYQTSEEAALPILCLSTQQQNRIALELHRRSEEDEALEWFQTRSQEGVERVYNRLQNVRSQATLFPAAELEDPDTFVVCPEPSWGYLSLLELRQRLGLDRVLMGSKAKRVFYCDRYLDGDKARILADLLQGYGLNSNSQVTIWVLEDSKSQPAQARKAELEEALTGLAAMGIQPQVKVQPWHQRAHFRHGRELEIHQQDGLKYKVIFDKGMDFLEVKADGTYRITEPTYVVITSQD